MKQKPMEEKSKLTLISDPDAIDRKSVGRERVC